MRMWRLVACIAASLVVATSAQRPEQPGAVDLVELDVVVLDRHDQPVTDLRQEDFSIKEDGHAVDLKTFSKVTALGSTQPDDGRLVVLLMDDIGVPVSDVADAANCTGRARPDW